MLLRPAHQTYCPFVDNMQRQIGFVNIGANPPEDTGVLGTSAAVYEMQPCIGIGFVADAVYRPLVRSIFESCMKEMI